MIPWDSFDVGDHRVTCPACGRGPRDKTLGLTIKPGGSAVAHCFRCGYAASYFPQCGICLTSGPRAPAKPASAKRETLSEFGRDLWAASKALSCAALDYLDARRCRIPPPDGDLRWHPCLKHPTGYSGPALVARVTDAVTAAPMSLHRTWVRPDGGKADVDPSRLLLGGHRKQGGVIRLWPDESVAEGLGVAEGIETALSLAWACAPVWACIDAGNLKALPVLPGVAALTVAADDDAAGRDAALSCAQCWADAGREVTFIGGNDGP
jgi:hypothetical protein